MPRPATLQTRRQADAARFRVLVVEPVVADQRVRHHDDLTTVGRVGEHFLIPRHGRVEDDLSPRLATGAQGLAPEDAAVAQDQERVAHECTTRPPTIVSRGPPRRVHPANGVLRLRE